MQTKESIPTRTCVRIERRNRTRNGVVWRAWSGCGSVSAWSTPNGAASHIRRSCSCAAQHTDERVRCGVQHAAKSVRIRSVQKYFFLLVNNFLENRRRISACALFLHAFLHDLSSFQELHFLACFPVLDKLLPAAAWLFYPGSTCTAENTTDTYASRFK